MKPFLKWPGGKQWLTQKYIHYFPVKYNTYYEPFLGGASVFFALQPNRAILSDINEELINLYTVMRNHPSELATKLTAHEHNHSKEYYYRIRTIIPADSISRAARTLYLNRTCYNGVYRVNKKGQFNVPIGTKNKVIYDISLFNEYSTVLQKCIIQTNDFSTSIMRAQNNDLIFADPPYTSSINDDCFIKYNDKLFSWNDQLRLHQELCKAKEKGVLIVTTNKDNNELFDLYQNSGFYISRLYRNSAILAKKDTARTISELFITSYKHT